MGEHDVIVIGAGPAGEVCAGRAAGEGLDDAAQLPWVKDRDITLYRGQARIEGERRVRVGDQVHHARRAVVIAVGSGAAIPPVPGLQEIVPWTNRQGTTAKTVPQRLTVLGGGAVGCELAQAWASLGAAVTLVEAEPALIGEEEPFAGEELAEALRAHGVDVRLGAKATEAIRGDAGEFTLTLDTGAAVTSDELLVAVGRTPHTGDLGLETVGLEPGVTITVDAHMRVPGSAHRDWLYAIGDVNGRALLTQAGKYQAMVAVANISNRETTADWDGPLTPRVVFTDPQIAAVGQTLLRALDAGIPARAVDAELGRTPGASFIGNGAPSARSRSGASSMRCRPSPRAPRCGSSCWARGCPKGRA